jgi:hypothetical protein
LLSGTLTPGTVGVIGILLSAQAPHPVIPVSAVAAVVEN